MMQISLPLDSGKDIDFRISPDALGAKAGQKAQMQQQQLSPSGWQQQQQQQVFHANHSQVHVHQRPNHEMDVSERTDGLQGAKHIHQGGLVISNPSSPAGECSPLGNSSWQHVEVQKSQKPKSKAAKPKLKNGERIFEGRITQVLLKELFMESSPGVSDVFVPLNIIDKEVEFYEGYVISVVAVEKPHGTCRFEATRLLSVDSGSRIISGPVTKVSNQNNFLFLDSGERPVYVPMQKLGIVWKVHLGEILTVLAHIGHENRWEATKLIQNSSGKYPLGVSAHIVQALATMPLLL
jgi:hypothetical protein